MPCLSVIGTDTQQSGQAPKTLSPSGFRPQPVSLSKNWTEHLSGQGHQLHNLWRMAGKYVIIWGMT